MHNNFNIQRGIKMAKSDFTATLLVDQSPSEAFNSILNVRKWWTAEPGIEGSTKKLGDEFIYRYKDLHFSKQKMTEFIPGKKVVWTILDSSLNFLKNKKEWNGTKIKFDIAKKGDKTEVRFTHMGLIPEIECYDACSSGWSYYINGSLKKLLKNTRKGRIIKKKESVKHTRKKKVSITGSR